MTDASDPGVSWPDDCPICGETRPRNYMHMCPAIKPVPPSPEGADFLASREASAEQVRGVFGIQEEKLMAEKLMGGSFLDVLCLVSALDPTSVERTQTKGGLAVSTIKAGPHPGDPRPFETAVVAKDRAVVVERYDDEEAARAGHAKWTAAVEGGQRRFTAVGWPGYVPDQEVEVTEANTCAPVRRSP